MKSLSPFTSKLILNDFKLVFFIVAGILINYTGFSTSTTNLDTFRGDDLVETTAKINSNCPELSEGDTILFGKWHLVYASSIEKGSTGTMNTPFGSFTIPLSTIQIGEMICVNGVWTIASYVGGAALAIFKSQPDYFASLNLNTDTLSIGQEICREKDTPEINDSTGFSAGEGLDAWGFDSTGTHHITGDTVDQNNFLQNGNHIDTGTPYNRCGCSREGLTADEEPCDPADCDAPTGSQAFADSIKNSLSDTIIMLATNIRNAIQDSLNGLNCSALRTQVNDIVTSNGIDRISIFGSDDKLLIRGMSKCFKSQPKQLNAIQGRDPVYVSLEEKHVNLYICDAKDLALSELDTLLNDLLSDTTLLFEFRDNLLSKIANWNTAQLNAISSDYFKFRQWIKDELGGWLDVDNLNALCLAVPVIEADVFDKFGQKPTVNYQGQYVLGMQSMKILSDLFPKFVLDSLDHQVVELITKTKTKNVAQKYAVYRKMASPPIPINEGMPVIIEKLIGNKTYKIFIDNIEIFADSLRFEAFCIIHDTRSERDLVFRGKNITIDETGELTNARLELLTNTQINLFNSVRLSLIPSEYTFVEWDIDGFKSMGIDATVEVCRNVLVPLDELTLLPRPEPELFAFGIQVQDISEWLEFTLTVNGLSPFGIAGAESDVAFNLNSLILDFSSSATPTFTPIEGYTSPYYVNNAMTNAWKGVYIENISATILKDLTAGNNNLTIAGQHLLIDGDGFTGKVSATNILSAAEGSMSGWPFSIEDIHLTFIKNSLHAGGIGGAIGLPICDENFDYAAQMDRNLNMSFKIFPQDTLDFDMLIARIYLTPESYLKAESVNDDFILSAKLHGLFDVDDVPAIAGVQIYLPDIKFKNLELSTEAPYFRAGEWGLAAESKAGCEIGSFSLLIKKLHGISDDTSGLSGVGFDLNLNLSGKIAISATGGLAILGKMHNVDGRHKWKFEKVAIHKFAIDGDFQGVTKIKGSVEWFGNYAPDTTYGKGFRGAVDVQFESIGVGVTAVAQFGRIEAKNGIEAYKYFFVDAYANLGALGSAGTFILTGFGGGIAHHMTMDASIISLGISNPEYQLDGLGTTISGATLVPSKDVGLSLNATVGFAVFSLEIFNGVGSFRIEFTDSFALDRIVITGAGQFMQSIDLGMEGDFEENAASAPLTSSPLSAYVSMDFNFGEKSLHGELQVFLNTPILYGAGEGRKLVDAELHFSPEEWYIYIGRPEEGQRCGLIVDIGILHLEATAYFDVGTNVPSMPPLPQTVRELAYKVNTNESLRQSGAGMVFGAALTIEIAIKIGSIAEGGIEAGAGFDVMMKKYEDLHCQGESEPVGINGWYASGQMWAYLRGYLKIFGVDIFEAGIAAVLQTRMPNPFWAQATVGVKVKLGPFNKKKSIKLELGKDCILVSDTTSTYSQGIGMDIITSINPYEGSLDNELYFAPEIEFAVPIGESIIIDDLQDPEIKYEFNTQVEEIRLYDQDSIAIPFIPVYNEDKSYVALEPIDFLGAGDTFTISVLVNIYKDGVKLGDEFKFSSFTTTAEKLKIIPAMNIKSAYPVNGMWNFYRGYNQGHIDLIKGQPTLFSEYNLPENTRQFMRMTDSNGDSHEIDYAYDGLNSIVTFTLDQSLLSPKFGYKLEIVRLTQPNSDDRNNGAPGGIQSKNGWTIPSNTTVHDADPVFPKEEIVYEAYFRVSDFETFEDKMTEIQGLPKYNTGFINTHSRAENLSGKYIELEGEQLFDGRELYGSTFLDPLVGIYSVLGSRTKEAISGAKSKIAVLNEDIGFPCNAVYNQFPDVNTFADGFRINSLPMDSTNVFTTFGSQHLDLGHQAIEILGKQFVVGDMGTISEKVNSSIHDFAACYVEDCQKYASETECNELMYDNAEFFNGIGIDNGDVHGLIGYGAGPHNFFAGSLRLK